MEGAPQRGRIDIAVVGASAGGVEALRLLVAALPVGLGCPVVIVLHLASHGTSVLAHILELAGQLETSTICDGDALSDGHLFVAPPDYHVLVERGRLRLSDGPRENWLRPAVNPTMRSAARVYGPGVVGIVLSGTRDDGTAGLAAIRAGGGRTLVQDLDEAMYSGMPASALAAGTVDEVLRVTGIARWLAAAAGAPRPGDPAGARSR